MSRAARNRIFTMALRKNTEEPTRIEQAAERDNRVYPFKSEKVQHA
jgi:hypothetical protein